MRVAHYCYCLIVALGVFFMGCASSDRTKTVEPTPVKIEELTGTLEISAAEMPEGQVWIFINRELRSKVPFCKSVSLAPGEYEIRYVTCAEELSSGGPYHKFYTVTGMVAIRRGESTPCNLSIIPLEYPDGFAMEQSAALKVKWGSFAGGHYRFCSNGRTFEDDVRRLSSTLHDEWQQFHDSSEWKVLSAAAQHLRNAPSARQVSIDLPNALGGGREVDADQLRALSEWVLEFFDSKVGMFASEGLFPIPLDTEANYRRAREVLRNADKQRDELRASVNDELKYMIESLERAPK